MRTYTDVGSKDYKRSTIDRGIASIKWEDFRKTDLPFCQGECLKSVISECNIPLSKISKMFLYGTIHGGHGDNKGEHGFYALDIKYKNGQAQVYIADNGCGACVVASDFVEAV